MSAEEEAEAGAPVASKLEKKEEEEASVKEEPQVGDVKEKPALEASSLGQDEATSAKEESQSPSSSSTSTGGELQEAPVVKSKRGSFVPKDIDINWAPKEADIVWTRFDKSRTQALAIIVRRPSSVEAETYDTNVPSVYCDTDAPDRYLVAFINSDAHVYPPRHYLVKFNFDTANKHKCMKAKVNTLSPWDKTKRKAVRDALAYAQGAHKFENSHNFRMCCTCCEQASEEFWKTLGLERGTCHIDGTPQVEKQKARVKRAQERKEREILKANVVREKTLRSLRARTRDGTRIKSKRRADSEESDEDVTTISDSESHVSNEVSHTGTDADSGAVASDEETAVDENDNSSGDDNEDDDDDDQGDEDFKPRIRSEADSEEDDEDVDENTLRRKRPLKKIGSGRRSVTKPSQRRIKTAVSEVEICAQKESTTRPHKRRKEADTTPENKDNPVDAEKEQITAPG